MNAIIVFFITLIAKIAVSLRYRITVKGFDAVKKAYGNKGVLFLPNHPALIDPVIMMTVLWRTYKPRALAVEKQIKGSMLKYFWKRIRVLPLPDMGVMGMTGHDAVVAQINCCIEALKNGDNLLLYPAGRIYHSKYEKLRGNGAVSRILQEYPEAKLVLARTSGLWGSEFGRAKGYQLSFGQCLKRHIKHILLGGIFFMPRRPVTIEFVTRPEDMPAAENKDLVNRYLEGFYNVAMRPNTYVPYTWFERGGIRTMPEPDTDAGTENTSRVPANVRETILEHLRELTGKSVINETDTLGTDLGLDSLIVAEIQSWLHTTFGHEMPSPEKLRTVASLMIAAMGESATTEALKPVPSEWFYEDDAPLPLVEAESICHCFLINAKASPNRPVWADQNVGVFTNRKMVLAVMALRHAIAAIPGERIGILMPATVYSTLIYLACQFAGKVPVMINWTVGNRNMKHCIKNAEVQHILTAEVVVERLKGTGVDFTGIEEHFVMLEKVAKSVSIFRKLGALFMSRFCWRSLWKAPIPKTAALIFTSGSENLPKAVPLSHRNIITDLVHAVGGMNIKQGDVLLGMLPPFHSFGLLLNTMFTCLSNIRCVYHANPTEGAMLSRIVSAYKVTFLCGTPTFIAGIFRNGSPEQLNTVNLVVTGAEKCRQEVLDLMHEKAPNGNLYEGYGISECGPIVSLNKPGHVKFGSIGRPLGCSEIAITDEGCTKRLPANTTGMLLVRGDNIFGGYMNYDGASPFVEFEGKSWYRTGDLVQVDEENYITFKGRLKRFVKIGGEMISLPAIEETLLLNYNNPALEKGPALAVEALGDDANPEITLFVTMPVTREEVNKTLLDHGFSPIHSIRRVEELAEIPLLGTGKTDYRTLKALYAKK
ncbi:MAG: AMP-binding protein [Victivallales bacterium]|nr:AMP-binding protein [Victivallales bacterium]